MKPLVTLMGVGLLSVGLLGVALAGGSGDSTPQTTPITAHSALKTVEDLSILAAPPFAGTPVGQHRSAEQGQQLHQYFQTHLASYTVSMHVNGRRERLFVTPGATESSSTVNTIMVYATTPHASALQREALLRVALGFLNGCWPNEAQSLNDPVWQRLLTRPWQKDLGWQDKAVGALKVSWSGREGFYPLGKGKGERAGLTLTWPKGSGRCTLSL